MSTSLDTDDMSMSVGQFSWTNLFAGMLIALSSFIVLMAFGWAMTMTVGDREVGSGFAVWAMLVGALSLFWGSAVTTSSNAEIRAKAAVFQGIAFWGTMIVTVATLSFIGLNLGISGFFGGVGLAANEDLVNNVARALREFGVTEDLITAFSMQILAAKPSPAQAWTSFIVLLLSMAACVAGSLFATQRDEVHEVGFRMEEREQFMGRTQENPT